MPALSDDVGRESRYEAKIAVLSLIGISSLQLLNSRLTAHERELVWGVAVQVCYSCPREMVTRSVSEGLRQHRSPSFGLAETAQLQGLRVGSVLNRKSPASKPVGSRVGYFCTKMRKPSRQKSEIVIDTAFAAQPIGGYP
jgi:hypothetical protein